MVKSNDSDEKRIKKIVDDWGVIREANKILPKDDFKLNLLNVIAELEDNDCHITRNFPISQLHKVTGIKKHIYRAYIDKISGWRIHLQYDKTSNSLNLKQIVDGQSHDDCLKIIKSQIYRFD